MCLIIHTNISIDLEGITINIKKNILVVDRKAHPLVCKTV